MHGCASGPPARERGSVLGLPSGPTKSRSLPVDGNAAGDGPPEVAERTVEVADQGPRIRQARRAADEGYPEGVPVAPGRDVAADALQDGAYRVEGIEGDRPDADRLPRPRHVGEDDVERRVEHIGGMGPAPQPHGGLVELGRYHVGPLFEQVVTQDAAYLLRGPDAVVDPGQPHRRVGDVGADGHVDVVHSVAREPYGVRASKEVRSILG